MSKVFSRRIPWLPVLVTLLTTGPAAAQSVDPAYRFRTHTTPHFAIHFHADVEHLAATLAEVAEATWDDLARRPGMAPPPFTHVVLTDQSDSANGSATPVPRNTIVIYAVAPTGTDGLNPRDWLRTIFVHEFAHVVHLDRSRGWAAVARHTLGRSAWAFPNLTLPAWQIEGLATWTESDGTGAGRLHAGDFTAIVREAARAGRLEPIDRVGGGLTDWPGGYAQYAYGLGFHDYLARRFGPDTFAELSAATAGALPWLGTRKFTGVYGSNLSTLWRDYEASLAEAADAPAHEPASAARRLTQDGHVASGPRFLPPRCETCGRELAYSSRTPHDRPALYRVRLDTLERDRLATRMLGSTMGIATDGAIYYDEREVRRGVGVYGDLRRLDPITGKIAWLTAGARLADPDVSPDGRTLVAVRNGAGRRDLVTIDLPALQSAGPDGLSAALRVVASSPGTAFTAPRWSPDGRRIAVARQHGADRSQIAVFDAAAAGSPGTIVTTAPDMRWVTPTWHPNGRIVAAGAVGDGPYNLFEIDIDTGAMRQLTETTGGATWPDISDDGRTVAYVGYGVDGSDVYEMPYAAATSISEPALRSPQASARSGSPHAIQSAGDEPGAIDDAPPYRPWRTLLPTSWTPLVVVEDEHARLGGATFGRDVLGYHTWGTSITWAVTRPPGSPSPGPGPDWSAYYAYERWQPHIVASLSRETSFFGGDATGSGLATPATVVERTSAIALQLPVRRMRYGHAFEVAAVYVTDERRSTSASISRNRNAGRLAWRFTSAQRPDYAISPERGVTFGIAAEFTRRAFGASGDATTVTADARAYLPGFGRHHVLALRAAGGVSRGDAGVTRGFVLGGGGSNPTAGTLDSDGATLLRGFAANTFAGRHVALVNVDYRIPLIRPQRGIGAWPVMLHTLHAAVTADAGHAWTRRFDSRAIKTSIGAELSANLVLGYYLPVTVAAGAAYGRDGGGTIGSGLSAYTRVGYAF